MARVIDYAEVYSNALVCNNAMACGFAKIFDNAEVFGNAVISGNAKVCDDADYIVFKKKKISGVVEGTLPGHALTINGVLDAFMAQAKN